MSEGSEGSATHRRNRRSFVAAIASAALVLVLTTWSLSLPWYVVSSPEASDRPGLRVDFYIDRVDEFRFENGTISSNRLTYDVPRAATIQATFGTVVAISIVFAAMSALFIACLAVTMARGTLGLATRVASILLAVAGWGVVGYFVLSFPAAMQSMQAWPGGFFSSVDVEWAGVVQTYGPGSGWLAAAGSACAALVALLGVRDALARGGATAESATSDQ